MELFQVYHLVNYLFINIILSNKLWKINIYIYIYLGDVVKFLKCDDVTHPDATDEEPCNLYETSDQTCVTDLEQYGEVIIEPNWLTQNFQLVIGLVIAGVVIGCCLCVFIGYSLKNASNEPNLTFEQLYQQQMQIHDKRRNGDQNQTQTQPNQLNNQITPNTNTANIVIQPNDDQNTKIDF